MYFSKFQTKYGNLLGRYNGNPDKEKEAFDSVLENYSEYINNKEKVIEIFQKIKTLQYINGGYIPEKEWAHNFHILIINGEKFEYKTGTGIDCQANKKNNLYNYYKLFLDAIYCFLQDSWYALNYSEDDFIAELGYEENVKSYKKGIAAYQSCKDSAQKCIAIWGRDTINNLFDIIQL